MMMIVQGKQTKTERCAGKLVSSECRMSKKGEGQAERIEKK